MQGCGLCTVHSKEILPCICHSVINRVWPRPVEIPSPRPCTPAVIALCATRRFFQIVAWFFFFFFVKHFHILHLLGYHCNIKHLWLSILMIWPRSVGNDLAKRSNFFIPLEMAVLRKSSKVHLGSDHESGMDLEGFSKSYQLWRNARMVGHSVAFISNVFHND